MVPFRDVFFLELIVEDSRCPSWEGVVFRVFGLKQVLQFLVGRGGDLMGPGLQELGNCVGEGKGWC